MKKILQLVGLGCILPMFLASASLAETVVEKVARTGFLTVGTRFDAIPYSYIDDKGELVGYSMDVLERIRKRLETRLGRPVTLQMIEANQPGEKINLIRSGEIDILVVRLLLGKGRKLSIFPSVTAFLGLGF